MRNKEDSTGSEAPEKKKQLKISKADIIEEHQKLLHDHELLREEVRLLKATFSAEFDSIRREMKVCEKNNNYTLYRSLFIFFLFWLYSLSNLIRVSLMFKTQSFLLPLLPLLMYKR
jgi:hypothetical protein